MNAGRCGTLHDIETAWIESPCNTIVAAGNEAV